MAIDACVSQYASVCSLSVSVLKLSASSCTNPVVPTRSTSAEFSAPTAAHVNTKNSAVRKVPPRSTMLSPADRLGGACFSLPLEIGHLRRKAGALDFAGLFLPDALPYS